MAASRPTRDDAWMYSAVFFGWPTTSISPSRGTSTPTWSIEVASTTSNGRSPPRRRRRLGFSRASLHAPARTPPCPGCSTAPRSNGSDSLSSVLAMSADEIREVSSPISQPVEVGRTPRERLGVAGDPRGHVVVEVAAHAGELAGGAEVADGRHVRVGCVARARRAASARRAAGPRRAGSRRA